MSTIEHYALILVKMIDFSVTIIFRFSRTVYMRYCQSSCLARPFGVEIQCNSLYKNKPLIKNKLNTACFNLLPTSRQISSRNCRNRGILISKQKEYIKATARCRNIASNARLCFKCPCFSVFLDYLVLLGLFLSKIVICGSMRLRVRDTLTGQHTKHQALTIFRRLYRRVIAGSLYHITVGTTLGYPTNLL